MCSQVTYKKKYNSRATSGFAKVRWWLVLLCIRHPIVNLYTPKQNGCVKIHNDRSRIKLSMINLFSPLKLQTAVVFFQIEYCGDTFVLYSSLQCRRFIWASQPLRHLRSFIQPATFDLELESTVGGGGGERLKEYSLPHPLPSLSTPRYKFRSLSSLPLLKKSKVTAIISSR